MAEDILARMETFQLLEEPIHLNPSVVEDSVSQNYFLLGRVVGEIQLIFDLLFRTLRTAWRTRGAVTFSEFEDGRFMASFELEHDCKRVYEGDTWMFNNLPLALSLYDGVEAPQRVPLETMGLWLQVKGLPPKFAVGAIVQDALRRIFGTVTRVEKDYKTCAFNARIEIPIDMILPEKKVVFMTHTVKVELQFNYLRIHRICSCLQINHHPVKCLWKQFSHVTENHFSSNPVLESGSTIHGSAGKKMVRVASSTGFEIQPVSVSGSGSTSECSMRANQIGRMETSGLRSGGGSPVRMARNGPPLGFEHVILTYEGNGGGPCGSFENARNMDDRLVGEMCEGPIDRLFEEKCREKSEKAEDSGKWVGKTNGEFLNKIMRVWAIDRLTVERCGGKSEIAEASGKCVGKANEKLVNKVNGLGPVWHCCAFAKALS